MPGVAGPSRDRAWGMPDPAAVEGGDNPKRQAFRETYTVLRRRLSHLARVPFASLDGEPGDAAPGNRSIMNATAAPAPRQAEQGVRSPAMTRSASSAWV